MSLQPQLPFRTLIAAPVAAKAADYLLAFRTDATDGAGQEMAA